MYKTIIIIMSIFALILVSCDDESNPTNPTDNTQKQDTTENKNEEEFANPAYKTLPNLPMEGTYTWSYREGSNSIFSMYLTSMLNKKLEYKGEKVTGYLCNEIYQTSGGISKNDVYYFKYDNAIFIAVDTDDDSSIINKAKLFCPENWVNGSSFTSDGISVSVSNTEMTHGGKKYHAQEYSFSVEGRYYNSIFAPGLGLMEMSGSRTLSLIKFLGT